MANLTEDNSTTIVETVLDSDKKIIEKKLEIAAIKDDKTTTTTDEIAIKETEPTPEKVPEKVPEDKPEEKKEEEKVVEEKKVEEKVVEEKKVEEKVVEDTKLEEKVENTKIEKEVIEKEVEKVEVKEVEKTIEEPVAEKTETEQTVEPVEESESEPKKNGRKKPVAKVVAVVESLPKAVGGRASKRKAVEVEAEPVPEVVKEAPVVLEAKPVAKKGKKIAEVPATEEVAVPEVKPKTVEPKVALLEAPLVIEGKRTRRSVQILDLNPQVDEEVYKKPAAKRSHKKKSPAKSSAKKGKAATTSRGKKSKSKEIIESETDEESVEDESMEDENAAAALEPSEEEIRKEIKGIIDGANLDKITMKTVVKDVHAKYPDSDLSSKKTFIKDVVKELLSSTA